MPRGAGEGLALQQQLRHAFSSMLGKAVACRTAREAHFEAVLLGMGMGDSSGGGGGCGGGGGAGGACGDAYGSAFPDSLPSGFGSTYRVATAASNRSAAGNRNRNRDRSSGIGSDGSRSASSASVRAHAHALLLRAVRQQPEVAQYRHALADSILRMEGGGSISGSPGMGEEEEDSGSAGSSGTWVGGGRGGTAALRGGVRAASEAEGSGAIDRGCRGREACSKCGFEFDEGVLDLVVVAPSAAAKGKEPGLLPSATGGYWEGGGNFCDNCGEPRAPLSPAASAAAARAAAARAAAAAAASRGRGRAGKAGDGRKGGMNGLSHTVTGAGSSSSSSSSSSNSTGSRSAAATGLRAMSHTLTGAAATATDKVVMALEQLEEAARLDPQVWCGVVWRGVVWRGVAWRGTAWYGVARRGMAWQCKFNGTNERLKVVKVNVLETSNYYSHRTTNLAVAVF